MEVLVSKNMGKSNFLLFLYFEILLDKYAKIDVDMSVSDSMNKKECTHGQMRVISVLSAFIR